MFKAEVIAASRNTHGQRLTTFLITFPRIVLSEFNTHRMLSKNTASSRAIPLHRMIDMVLKTPFVPLRWMAEHTGMQGTEYLNEEDSGHAIQQWFLARDMAVAQVNKLWARRVTKQLCNRLLEPFAWCTMLVSGTEWENFFALRASPHAEIHMAHLAELMLEAYNNAEVKQLQPGEWHIPFAMPESDLRAYYYDHIGDFVGPTQQELDELSCKVSTGKCAQTSYTVMGEDDKPMNISKLLTLHDRLATSGHWSPMEHCARTMSLKEYRESARWEFNPQTNEFEKQFGWCGNFRGFIQYRKLFENENQSDSRVKH